MPERAWRNRSLSDALARPDLRDRARRALDRGPLCDACLGRLFAQVSTGLSNAARGQTVRQALGAGPPAGPCSVCGNLFDALDPWLVRARDALRGWEFETFAVASHADPAVARREADLWQAVGGDLAEPLKQAFNRALGIALAAATGRQVDLVRPDVLVLADHAAGAVTLRVAPLLVAGRYRKLVRGLPQCRWRAWPTSIQQVVGDPILSAAGAEDHRFHGCGREDTDVRCLAARPFVLEVRRPRRRRLDWAALAETVNRSGMVEVTGLAPCGRQEIARLKALRPEKSYRAAVRLGADVPEERLAGLAGLVGLVAQRTPQRVLRRRPDRRRRRRVTALEWRRSGPQGLVLTVRAQAGTYIKELVTGDGGRTRPSVAQVLGVEARCEELDVVAIHLDEAAPA